MFTTLKLICSLFLGVAVMAAMPASADDSGIGNTEKESASHEKAKEKSKSKSHSKKVAKSDESSKSYSIDVNINGLLLREFTTRYERDFTGTGTAGEYFGICKPITRALMDYPVYTLNHGKEVLGINEFRIRLQTEGQVSYGGENSGLAVNPTNQYISRYAQCRITASYWISEAGDRAATQKVSNENEVRDRIRQVFDEMDTDENTFQTLRQRARTLWKQASCAPWLQSGREFKSPQIECGVFSYVGKAFVVENRETLSESSIDGRSYKIAVSAKANDTVAEDDSTSVDDRVSSSERKSASMSANKSK